MTIDKICIHDFGNLSNLTITPSRGLNIIYAPNESGKSTLLSFIKYIFYGTKQKKTKGELTVKERYMPWNGMPMSGSIEFTQNGKKYIISRTDGAKNGSRTLEVRELPGGTLVNIADVGRHFFSVGEKAFSDSCFVTDIFSITDSDDDILALLSNSASDNASYARVKKELEEKILSLSSSKRAGSDLSVLTKLIGQEQTNRMAAQKELDDISLSLSSFDNKKELLKKDLATISGVIDDYNRANIDTNYQNLLGCKHAEEKNLSLLFQSLSDAKIEDDKAQKKGHMPKILWCISFVFTAACVGLIAFDMPFYLAFISAFIAVLTGTLGILQCKKRGHSAYDSLPLVKTLKDQIEISTRRIEDIDKDISRLENENPGIKEAGCEKTNSFTTEEINGIIARREKCTDELKALDMRTKSLDARYAELLGKIDSCQKRTDELNAKVCEVKTRLGLLNTALEILEKAFSTMRDEFAPRLCRDAFSLLSTISQGRFSALASNESFEASVRIDNEYKDVRSLSKGTQALVYLALRIAVCNYLSPSDPVPVFFDDVLSGFDDQRCERMMEALGEISKQRQIFLCTCRSRESQLPGGIEDASVVFVRKD